MTLQSPLHDDALWPISGNSVPKLHTGVFALKIISNNAVLLVILISTTFTPLGSSRVSNEAKNYRELEFLGLNRCFSVIIE